MFQKIDYLMVMVSKMDASVKFYRDALGLKLKFESPGWSEFETGPTTLALHISGRSGGGELDHSVPGMLRLGFNVEDVDHAAQTLKDRGVRFVQEPTLQPQEGIKLGMFVDPDGMRISIAQNVRRTG
jgi:lactoylglutathione lyase